MHYKPVTTYNLNFHAWFEQLVTWNDLSVFLHNFWHLGPTIQGDKYKFKLIIKHKLSTVTKISHINGQITSSFHNMNKNHIIFDI